jgi:hypothetical protein
MFVLLLCNAGSGVSILVRMKCMSDVGITLFKRNEKVGKISFQSDHCGFSFARLFFIERINFILKKV